ncbi:transglycosylase domain-containing protein [Paenibacillus sp. GCM10012307]|uniref:PBP1A family penicillin-binding protein n=1 Tax=Paenibacillus roseus TaxID=2798579 RepID=A0A934J5A4_9BACL|nr:PBP1A family penicillin-binding protein [Paenibacillus roseus]MBJ6360680.1 PBP1A family penicillin-binding protein [Paenibacillus roseus]
MSKSSSRFSPKQLFRLFAKRERPPRTLWSRLVRLLKIAGAVALLFLITIAGLLLYLRSQSLPAAVISQSSQMYDSQGNVMDTFLAGENRKSVRLDAISPYLVQATVAVEDQRFYQHFGFDLKGVARAAFVNLENRKAKQGASTLTQQLARNLYLSHERTWKRKLKEAAYTVQLETTYSKDQILEMYLNQIYYGHGAYGAEAASRLYFGKPARDLSLAESSMLAGIPKGPTYYSPFNNMKKAKDRQKLILSILSEDGYITANQAKSAFAEILSFRTLGDGQQEGFAPYFRDYIRLMAVDKLGIDENLLNEGGIRIFTTLDPVAQRAAEAAVAEGLPQDSELQAALIAIDPRTGYVKAMVGGRDYKQNQYNRVLAKTRQPGSSFKPLVYITALQEGGMTPLTPFMSEPTAFTYDEGRYTYEPHNYNERYFNRNIDMRTAIASSDNIYAVNTIMAVGAEKVISMARKLGIESELDPVPSLALGTFPVSPFEMASAFSTFASAGTRAEPTAILRIENSRGEVIYEASPRKEQIITPANAYVITSLMESVFETGGTGNRVSSVLKRPVAGKTGTTAADAWLVGYTPELTAAVWVGYDKGRTISVSESHKAAPIFAKFIEGALESVPPKIFPIPEGVVSVYINPLTGKLANAACADEQRLETFAAGTEPTEYCADVENGPDNDKAVHQGEGAGTLGEQKRQSWWQHLKQWWDS